VRRKCRSGQACGARTRSGLKLRMIQKKSRKQIAFSGTYIVPPKSLNLEFDSCFQIALESLVLYEIGGNVNQTRVSLHPSFIQTITVGPGVPPSHAFRRSRLKCDLHNCSWAIPPIGNSLTRDLLSKSCGASVTLPRRFLFGWRDYISVRFNNAIDWADTYALG
jgi:hypothetical protein